MQKIAKKFVEVMKECNYVEKNGTNQFHKYQYATSADVLAKVNASLVRHGIASIAVPSLIDMVDVTTAKGNIEKMATIEMHITLVDVETGETIEIVGIGSGQDSGDKAIMKAETAAIKYAYLMSLAISTGDDPEADTATDTHMAVEFHQRNHPTPAKYPKAMQAHKKTDTGTFVCADCGTAISERVKTYSEQQFGRPLCMRCQHQSAQSA